MDSFNNVISDESSAVKIRLIYDNSGNTMVFDRSEAPNHVLRYARVIPNTYANLTELNRDIASLVDYGFTMEYSYNISRMFYNCRNLRGAFPFDKASMLRDISMAFLNCRNMIVPQINSYGNYLTNVENMYRAFMYTGIENDTSLSYSYAYIPDKVTDASYAFYGSGVAYLNLNGLGKNALNAAYCFSSMPNIYVQQNRVDTIFTTGFPLAENVSYMFHQCKNIRFNQQIDKSELLNHLNNGNFFKNAKNLCGLFSACSKYTGPAIVRARMTDVISSSVVYNALPNSCAYMYDNCSNITYSPIVLPDDYGMRPVDMQGCFRNCVNMQGSISFGDTNILNGDALQNDNDMNLYQTFAYCNNLVIDLTGTRSPDNAYDMLLRATNCMVLFNNTVSWRFFNSAGGMDNRNFDVEEVLGAGVFNMNYYNYFTDNYEVKQFGYTRAKTYKDTKNNITVMDLSYTSLESLTLNLNHLEFNKGVNQIHFRTI